MYLLTGGWLDGRRGRERCGEAWWHMGDYRPGPVAQPCWSARGRSQHRLHCPGRTPSAEGSTIPAIGAALAISGPGMHVSG